MPEGATDITGLSFLTLELEPPLYSLIVQTVSQVISENDILNVHVLD